MLEVIESQLDAVTRNVFSTMLNWQVESATAETARQPGKLDLMGVNGSIGFGGEITATLFFSASEPLAKKMTEVLLGDGMGEQPGQITDVVGELTNMLAGGCKTALCDLGYPVVMSIPTVIRGRALRAVGKDVQFVASRAFKAPATGETFDVIMLGRRN